jgi:hypothetical protein
MLIRKKNPEFVTKITAFGTQRMHVLKYFLLNNYLQIFQIHISAFITVARPTGETYLVDEV